MAALPKPDSCRDCQGYSWPCPSPGMGFVHPDGAGANGVLLVFEAAGEQESLAGLPLVGKAGLTFQQMLQRGGLNRADFRIANVLSCRPPNNYLVGAHYEQAVIRHCAPNLDAVIESMRPRCIVAGGAVALRRLLPGCPVGIDDARGYVHRYRHADGWETWLVPTIHPSRIARGQTSLTAVFIHDVQKAVEIARDGFQYLDTSFYVLDPVPADAEKWVRQFEVAAACRRVPHLSCDIETPDKDANEDELEDEDADDIKDASYTILRCGYSYHDSQTGKPHAITMPWGGVYAQYHRRLLGSVCDKLWWNKSFDVPRVTADGVELRGVQHDGMESWHVLNSDLRRSLGTVSSFLNPRVKMWKHLSGDEPAFYNTQDAYTADVNQTKTTVDLKTHKLWPVYLDQILDMDPVYTSMTAAGMPIDPVRRLAFAKELTELQDGVRAQMQIVVPQHCRRVEPKEGYKVAPSEERQAQIRANLDPGEQLVEWLFDATEITRCNRCGEANPKKAHFKPKPSTRCDACDKKWTAKHGQTKATKACAGSIPVAIELNACTGAEPVVTREGITRWARVQRFVPSPKQILAYMAAMKHQPIYEGRGEQRRPTTNVKAIQKVRAKQPADPLYPLILQDRKLGKLSGTYIGKYEEVEVSDDYVILRNERAA